MNIRPPSLSEIPAVFDLEKDVFGSPVYPAIFFFRQAFDLWGDLFFVAGDDGGPLDGYVVGAPCTQPEIMWILSLAVRENQRSRRAIRARGGLSASAREARQAHRSIKAVRARAEAVIPVSTAP